LLYTVIKYKLTGQLETIEQCCRIIAEIASQIQYGLISTQLDTHPTDSSQSYISSKQQQQQQRQRRVVYAHCTLLCGYLKDSISVWGYVVECGVRRGPEWSGV